MSGQKRGLVDLVAFVPAPSGRVRAVDWADTEHTLGTTLPSDYKAMAQAYGSGLFAGLISLLLPSTDRLVDLVSQTELAREEVRETRELFPESYAPGDVLPWATTLNGDLFYWHTTSSDPEAWTVVISDGSPDWWSYEGGAAEFLLAVLDGTWQCDLISPATFMADPRHFSPA